MSIDDVTEKLRTIGPFVRYDKLEMPEDYRVHRWFIGSEPQGSNSCLACLAVPIESDFGAFDWPSLLYEGRDRYERAQNAVPRTPRG